MPRLTLIAFVALACANPVNRRTSEDYGEAAHRAELAGDWRQARTYLDRAIVNARLGGVEPRRMALLWYEYGRASGVLCEWADAEHGLKEAFALDSASSGPVYMALYELGRMHYDRKQYAPAVQYFTRVDTIFQREKLDQQDPLGFAEYLDEYATALEQTGQVEEARPRRVRATKLREVFPSGVKRTDKTPYGTQCGSR